MPELIEAGMIYIAQPPLYRVRKGKEAYYAYDEKEREEYSAGSRAATARRRRTSTSSATRGSAR
jgi:DNA gyrase/topoisomerase IV subunit B